MDVAAQAKVEILARWASAGSSVRRLGNVLAIGATALVLEMEDDAVPDGTTISIAFVVPGTSARVVVEGVVGGSEGLARSVRIRGDLSPVLLDFVQRRIRAGDDQV